jgi:hypothetical protein
MSPTLRRHGTNVVLVALVAVAGVAMYVFDRGSVTTTERATRRKNLLSAFRDDEVTAFAVTVEGKTGRVSRGALDDAGQRPWRVEIDGTSFAAEESVVDQYLASLRDGVVERRVTGGSENAGEARTMIVVDMGPRHYRVTLRGTAPTPTGAVYAEIESGDERDVAVITAQLAAALTMSREAFRQKALMPYSAAELGAFSLDGEGGPRHLVRSAWTASRGGSFRFDGSTPEGTVRASSAALEKVWEAGARMSPDAFLADAEADKALAREVTLTLTPKNGGKVTIDLGGACPGHPDDIVAVRRDERGPRVNACVPRGVLEGLSLPAAELVDRRMIDARADEVIDVKLASGATTLAMARVGSQWHEQTPTDRNIDAELGRGLLDRLLDISATKWLTGDAARAGALGLDAPRATVRVVSVVPGGGDGGDGERVELLELGAEQGGVAYVRRVEDGAVAEVPAEAAAAMLPSEIGLRSKKVFDEPFAGFRAIRVIGSAHAQRMEKGADGSWALVEPRGAGLALDGSLLGELADALGELRAERWVGAARPEHGLERPRLVIEADIGDQGAAKADAGGGRHTIRVSLGAPAGATGSFARAGDDAEVFVAPRRLESAADRWLLDRTKLVAEIGHVTRVTMSADGGKRVVLEAGGGAFHVVGAGTDPAASARAAAVREALGDLVAEAVVSIGAASNREGFEKPTLTVDVEETGQRMRLRFGAGDALRGTSVFYVRRDGIDATYAVAQSKVQPLLEAVGAGR